MNKNLTPAEKDFLIRELAQQNGIESATLRAIIEVESSGSGFYNADSPFAHKCKTRFEPDYFQRFSSTRPFFLPTGITVDAAKRDKRFTGRIAYEKALLQSPSAAIRATSFGLGQIMGFNYQQIGYSSLTEFSSDMEESEYYQLETMIKFICSRKPLLIATQQRDFQTIALLYNGPNYLQLEYDKKLMNAYRQFSNADAIRA